jgi:hypothetical protein
MHLSHLLRRLAPLALAAALGDCAATPELRPFSTDGCSLFPDRLASSGKDWCLCCVAHDRVYWRGGTDADRLKADQDLRACVASTTGDSGLASLMHVGVRIGGGPYLPTWFRWGYGWTYGRFYQPLQPEESALADKLEATYAASVGFGVCPGVPPAASK